MRKIILAAVLATGAAQVASQELAINPAAQNAQDGDTGIAFSVVYTEGATAAAGITAMIDVTGAGGDSATFVPTSLACTGVAPVTCPPAASTDGTMSCAGFVFGGTFATGTTVANCTVDLTAGATPPAVATIQSIVTGNTFSDAAAVPFGGTGTNGVVNVVAGSNLTINPTAPQDIAAPLNGTSPTATFTVGADGAVTGVACTDDGNATWNLGAAGDLTAATTFDIIGSCNTAAAGMSSSTATCTGTGDQANATMVTATINCDVTQGAPSPAVSTTNVVLGPAAPGQIAGGAFQALDNEVSSPGYQLTGCTAGNGLVTISNDTGAVAPGAARTVGLQATAAAGFLDTVTCTTDQGVTLGPVNVTILLQALQVPTLSQWAMIAMALALAGFGVFRLRRGES